MPDENRTVVRRLLEEVWAGGKLDSADDLIDPGYRAHLRDAFSVRMSRWTGPQIVRAEVDAYRSAFPDLAVEVGEVIAESDTVAAVWKISGTNTGKMMLLPRDDGGADETLDATGKDLSASGTTLFRMAGGRIEDAAFWWEPIPLLDQVRLLTGRTLRLAGGVEVSLTAAHE